MGKCGEEERSVSDKKMKDEKRKAIEEEELYGREIRTRGKCRTTRQKRK
jgi:hypothetical protein